MGTELYRDPVFDGATDPMVIFNRAEGTWWMLYTSRTRRRPVPVWRGSTVLILEWRP